jgi:lipoprotein-releasing system permease protein
MGYPLSIALRYLASKKRSMISISTALAIGGVLLGVAALTIVMSVTGGFLEQFRDKVLGVNAHVLVLKYSIDFREYRDIMKKVEGMPHVIGVAPFVINPMMVTHQDHTATGVLLKGVDPELLPTVLDLPKHITDGSLSGLRRDGAKPPERSFDPLQRELDAPRPAPTTKNGEPPQDSLLRAIQREVDDEMKRDAGAPALTAAAAPPPPPAPSAELKDVKKVAAAAAPLPRRETMTPTGGYKSQLPDDDFIPDAVDPDPCKSADRVAHMPGIVVGRTLAKQLDVGLGDCVQVTSPQIGLSFGGARSPIAKQFRVIAIFEAGFDQYDSKLVYTDLYEAQDFYEYGDSVTGIEMKLDDIDKADAVAKDITLRLNNGLYNTMTWSQLNHGLFTALWLQRLMMSVALGLMIVLASCTVVATLIMVVLEKKKEIAVLKAIGGTNGAILRIFLYQGGFIGLAGTTLGIAIGWACCRFLVYYAFPLDPKVYFISQLPVSMHAFELIVPSLVAMGVCLLATIPPALYAAWLRPADGLRAE